MEWVPGTTASGESAQDTLLLGELTCSQSAGWQLETVSKGWSSVVTVEPQCCPTYTMRMTGHRAVCGSLTALLGTLWLWGQDRPLKMDPCLGLQDSGSRGPCWLCSQLSEPGA